MTWSPFLTHARTRPQFALSRGSSSSGQGLFLIVPFSLASAAMAASPHGRFPAQGGLELLFARLTFAYHPLSPIPQKLRATSATMRRASSQVSSLEALIRSMKNSAWKESGSKLSAGPPRAAAAQAAPERAA